MAYKLVKEVLDHAPDMTPAERLLLVCIAEECRGTNRLREIASEVLQRRTGLGARGLRDACTRLEARGFKVRVRFSTDKHGQPVYAVPGRVCQWLLPVFDPPKGCDCETCSTEGEPGRLLPEEEEPQRRQAEPQLHEEEPQRRQAEPQLLPNHPFQFPSDGDRSAMIEHIRLINTRRTQELARQRMSSDVPLKGTLTPPI
jgi:hypothetical protein